MKTYIYIALLLVMPVLLQGQYTWKRHAVSSAGQKQSSATYTANSSVQHYEAGKTVSSGLEGNTGFITYEIIQLDIKVDLTAFLEGPFNNSSMQTILNNSGLLPLQQPYNQPPWNYPGTESVVTIPPDVVDWVLIELRDAVDAPSATPATIIERQAAFIRNDGQIIDISGTDALQCVSTTISNNLFVVVYHRNHLPIMTANPLTQVDGIYEYNFKFDGMSAYGTDAQKNLGTNIYGMYAADANADGNINLSDKTIWTNQAGTQGYVPTDFNMDGQVNNADKNDKWLPNEGEESQVPE